MKNSIKLSKLLTIIMSFMLISTMSFAADSSTSTIDFSGRVTANSCSLATDSLSMNVHLGEVPIKTLQQKGQSSRVPFTIRLIDCDPTVNSIVMVFEDALNSQSGVRNYLISSLAGDEEAAQNVGVNITRAEETQPIILGQEITLAPNRVSGSALPEQAFPFNAFITKTSETAPTPGIVRARATVTIRANTAVMPTSS